MKISQKTWLEIRGMTLVYFLLLEILLIATLQYWPQIREALEKNTGVFVNLMPGDFLKRIVRGMANKSPDFAYRAYIATEQFFRSVNIIGISAAVLLGTGTIARERENGTLEFLLSRPIKRSAILWSKTWCLMLAVTLPIFLSSATIIPITKMLGFPYQLEWGPIFLASFHGCLFVLVFLLIAIAASTLFRAQVHVAFFVGGLIVTEVGVYFIKGLRQTSVFMLSDFDIYMPILVGNRSALDVFLKWDLWLILAIVLIYSFTLRRFKKMDL
jgi:ABC-2 type transport system permease protein